MTKFKVGDKFIPRKPKNIYPFHRHWVEQMKNFWGRTMTIDEIHLVSEGASFNVDYCEKAVDDTEYHPESDDRISAKAMHKLSYEYENLYLERAKVVHLIRRAAEQGLYNIILGEEELTCTLEKELARLGYGIDVKYVSGKSLKIIYW